jgi:hypothetical protein
MDNKLRPGHYRHYKGNCYEVLGVARHSETEEYALKAIPFSLAKNCASDRRNN